MVPLNWEKPTISCSNVENNIFVCSRGQPTLFVEIVLLQTCYAISQGGSMYFSLTRRSRQLEIVDQ